VILAPGHRVSAMRREIDENRRLRSLCGPRPL